MVFYKLIAVYCKYPTELSSAFLDSIKTCGRMPNAVPRAGKNIGYGTAISTLTMHLCVHFCIRDFFALWQFSKRATHVWFDRWRDQSLYDKCDTNASNFECTCKCVRSNHLNRYVQISQFNEFTDMLWFVD